MVVADGGGRRTVADGQKQQQMAVDCGGWWRTSESAADGGRWWQLVAEGVDPMVEGCDRVAAE